MLPDELVLGIDGGGSKTIAWLAAVSSADRRPLGRGLAGPVNVQSVGWATAIGNLEQAVARALADAAVASGPLAAAVLALAGSDREENRRGFGDWARNRSLAARFEIVHDALPVLAAGAPQGWGIALISGTGSLAFGRSADGRTSRAGGWGYLLGDEGSGYAIAVAGLRAAAKAADGRGQQTAIGDLLLQRLGVASPGELVSAVYPFATDRTRIAALADVVFDAARQGDAVADVILTAAADELVEMVLAVAHRLGFSATAFDLALSGGVLTNPAGLRARLEECLPSKVPRIRAITAVAEPVAGAIRLACNLVGH